MDIAINRVLKISLTSSQIGSHDLIIESNSANAIKWCNGENNGPWNLTLAINLICRHLNSGHGIQVVYKNRESNMVADSLAKQGLLTI